MSHIVGRLLFPAFLTSLSAPLPAVQVTPSVASVTHASSQGIVSDSRTQVKIHTAQMEAPLVAAAAECLLQAAPAQKLSRSKTVIHADDDFLLGHGTRIDLLDVSAGLASSLDSFGDEASRAEDSDSIPHVGSADRHEMVQIELLDMPEGESPVPWLLQYDAVRHAEPPEHPSPAKRPRVPTKHRSPTVLEVSRHFAGFGDESVVAQSAPELLTSAPVQFAGFGDEAKNLPATSLLQISQAEDSSGSASVGLSGSRSPLPLSPGRLPYSLSDLTIAATVWPALFAMLGLILSLTAMLLKQWGFLSRLLVPQEKSAENVFVASDRGS